MNGVLRWVGRGVGQRSLVPAADVFVVADRCFSAQMATAAHYTDGVTPDWMSWQHARYRESPVHFLGGQTC